MSAGCRGQMVLFSQNQTCRRYFTTSSFHTITSCCSNLEFHFLNAMIACTETSNTRDPHVSICTGGAGDGSTGQPACPAGLHSLLSVPWAGGSQRPAEAHSDFGPSFVGRNSYLSWQSINILRKNNILVIPWKMPFTQLITSKPLKL